MSVPISAFALLVALAPACRGEKAADPAPVAPSAPLAGEPPAPAERHDIAL